MPGQTGGPPRGVKAGHHAPDHVHMPMPIPLKDAAASVVGVSLPHARACPQIQDHIPQKMSEKYDTTVDISSYSPHIVRKIRQEWCGYLFFVSAYCQKNTTKLWCSHFRLMACRKNTTWMYMIVQCVQVSEIYDNNPALSSMYTIFRAQKNMRRMECLKYKNQMMC